MNLSTALLALTLAGVSVGLAPSAHAFQDASTPQPSQDTSPPREEGPEDHTRLRQDAHEAGQEIKEGARDVGHAVDRGAHHVGAAIHRTAHWRRYHVCTHYWHHHCTRWARRR